MKNFIDWFREKQSKDKPWLILGKGPGFSRRAQYDLSKFSLLALNHAARELAVDVAHVIDVEVLEQSGAELEKNAGVLVMPCVPHYKMSAKSEIPLSEWIERMPVLEKLDSEGRLFCYDLSSSNQRFTAHPKVQVIYFSSEAALGLFGLCGVRQIRSLGLDGGANYAREFDDIANQTCLANGQPSFDLQFEQFPRLINEFALDYSALDEESPVRIFIGASPSEWLPARVLEYSLLKNASMSVNCFRLSESKIQMRMPKEESNRPRTPFSFQRFMIPELMEYTGRAIYLDSDMLVFKDIKKLWQMPFSGADILCTNALNEQQKAVQFSVMLMDCKSLNWKLDDLIDGLDKNIYTYESLVHKMVAAKCVAARISPVWNFLDRYVPGSTALLHYTNMEQQPWLSCKNPAAAVWVEHLREAIMHGFIKMEDVRTQVELGYVRPSLLLQLENNIVDPSKLSNEALALDANFRVPYEQSCAGAH